MSKAMRESGRVSWKIQLVSAIVIFFFFGALFPVLKLLGFDASGNVLLDNALRLVLSLVLAVICYRLIEGSRVLLTRPQLSVSTRVWVVALWLAMVLLFVSSGVLRNVLAVFKLSPSLFLASFFAALGAAVFEELLVRGLLVSTFMKAFEGKKYKLLLVGFFSALVFGVLHYYNLHEATFVATSKQVFFAFAVGLPLVAIRIRYNNLWLPILIHFLIDFQPSVTKAVSNGAPWIALFAITAPMILVAVGVLSSMDRDIWRAEKSMPSVN
ncbi:CPBP family intramembrane glutamic endopeptidase [Actinobaculum sp. 313]|uniref:CPBP family intramembrane glutamic endopeptidase n=1 Tax=Actinobaculum sp. 313 TaxID=2495645 RepID=UPI000D526A24|nr:CPBP family intramembrane glutamic endopeptidase [Actinobaculum sp. 313]AWE41863.1 hypothetical protein DDD63_02805 [Actinobaculum sp. 313]